MKSHSSKKNEASKSHSTKPFFTKNGNFFSRESANKSSYFPKTTIQPKLSIGQSNDRFEKEADAIADQVVQTPSNKKTAAGNKNTPTQNISTKPQIMKSGKKGGTQASPALANQIANSKGKGSPLSSASNKTMSNKMGHDFSQVQVHTGEQANQMNQSLNAKAFTHGSDIYFNKGQYNPSSTEGKHLLAHELTHVVQQSGGQQKIQRQEATTGPAATQKPVPRQDVVYVMGSDKSGFYTVASRFFKAKFPNAVFVDDQRSLDGLLTHLTTTFSSPLGTIFIISHANEDGTLGFKLDSSDSDKRLSVVELRDAINNSSGISTLTSPTSQVDDQTKIKIKGCDLGRNQEIVELFDKAFNGKGTVTAPTHEQVYSTDSKAIEKGTAEAMTEHMETFEKGLAPLPPKPKPVDKKLKGEERTEAQKKYTEEKKALTDAKKKRKEKIDAEKKSYKPTAKQKGEASGVFESLSGPMFQRTGSTLFTAGELQPKVDTLYDHLSKDQRKKLVSSLIKKDSRKKADAQKQGVFKQQGQRHYKYETPYTYTAPQNFKQAKKVFANHLKKNKFVPTDFEMSKNTTNGITIYDYKFLKKTKTEERWLTATSSPIPSDQSLIDEVKLKINNQDKFSWRVVENKKSDGKLVKKVIRERVVAYLHHKSLDASKGDRFLPAESDRRFFAESTFTPPPSTP